MQYDLRAQWKVAMHSKEESVRGHERARTDSHTRAHYMLVRWPPKYNSLSSNTESLCGEIPFSLEPLPWEARCHFFNFLVISGIKVRGSVMKPSSESFLVSPALSLSVRLSSERHGLCMYKRPLTRTFLCIGGGKNSTLGLLGLGPFAESLSRERFVTVVLFGTDVLPCFADCSFSNPFEEFKTAACLLLWRLRRAFSSRVLPSALLWSTSFLKFALCLTTLRGVLTSPLLPFVVSVTFLARLRSAR